MSCRRQYSLRQVSDHQVHTSLLDNWHCQITPMTLFPHSLPNMLSQDGSPLPVGNLTSFNINEDDMDCPGHGSHRLLTRVRSASELRDEVPKASNSFPEDRYNVYLVSSSSSEGLYDSSDDVRGYKLRAMSVDEVQIGHSDDEDDSNNNVFFMLPQADEAGSDWGLDIQTPTVQTPPLPVGKRERRASLDNSVLGVWEGRKEMEEMGGRGWQRNAVTEPGTPAEPCTPVASFVSLEQLLADSHYLINKLQPFLCAERVNQMTRTYNDIEAVTNLLEEKERDLELAARIGQTLLSKNKELSGRKEVLEEQLNLANDTIKQLRHELSKKVQQLEVYDQDLQNQNPQDDSPGAGGGEPAVSPGTVEKLQKKVGNLEEENLSLRLETAQLRSDTETYEEKEKKLMKSSLRQFAELSERVDSLTDELQTKKKENSCQKDEIGSLVMQLNEVCHRIGQLTEENADLLDKLQAAEESKTQLTRELSIQKDKYDELFESLEQLRSQQPVLLSPSNSTDVVSMESLASELQHSLSLELSQEEDKPTSSLHRSDSWKIFETAKAARKAIAKSRNSSMQMSPSVSSCWETDSLATSIPNSDTESFTSEGYYGDMDSVCGSTVEFGRPGIPGSNDLQTALQRLALRQGRHEDEVIRTLQEPRSGTMSPVRIPGTPDTVSSGTSGYSYLGCSKNAQSNSQYKMSSKLQIIKPMEGSVTLQQWQRLAQPHLGGLFEQRDGVKVKGERKLDLEEEAYTLSDFEECEDGTEYASSLTESSPDRMWSPPASSSVNPHSAASHHSLPASLTTSFRKSTASPQPVASSTPHSLPVGKKGSSNYTMSLGLAAVLQERDSSLARALLKNRAPSPRTAAGSRSKDTTIPVVPAESVATVSARASTMSAPEPDNSSTDSSGLLGKLLSSGYSLLWNKTDGAAAAAAPPTSLHSPDTVSSDDVSATVARQPATRQVFPRGGTGVLGAISTLRKNGIL